MRNREPWQHAWDTAATSTTGGGGVVRACTRAGCPWQMLSRPNSNRYRNGPNGEWKHMPKDCKGNGGRVLNVPLASRRRDEAAAAASIMTWPKESP